MKKILIRADDLGYSEGINYGIAKSVREGIIKSVGIMTNMPAAEQGLKLLADIDVCYGQHTNICIGKPLSDPKLIPSITNENGEFKSSREYRSAKEDFVNLDEVIIEIEAQYHQFIKLTGRKPQYFEGHAVSSDNFRKGLKIVAAKYDLKYSGMPSEAEPHLVGRHKVYMWMESMLPEYDPIKTLKKMVLNAHEDACDVLICHPGYLDAYILKTSSLTIPRTLEVEMACDPEVKAWLAKQNIGMVTYSDL